MRVWMKPHSSGFTSAGVLGYPGVRRGHGMLPRTAGGAAAKERYAGRARRRVQTPESERAIGWATES